MLTFDRIVLALGVASLVAVLAYIQLAAVPL